MLFLLDVSAPTPMVDSPSLLLVTVIVVIVVVLGVISMKKPKK
jgi:hypothetical protein